MQRYYTAGVVLVCLQLISTGRALAEPTTSTRFRPHIVNGVTTAEYPTTGALLYGTTAANAGPECSGTLIGCDTFLTAAHCVCDGIGLDCQGAGAPDPSLYFVYLQHAGLFSVASIAIRPDFDFPVGDVAVLKLSLPVTGVAPTHINTTATPSLGSAAVIAGFGRTGGSNQDYGVKRAGSVTLASCTDDVSNTTSVCWAYNNPSGAPGTNSNTCNGDSGGPLFADFGAGPVIAGITSGGSSDDCLATDHSYDANVYNYRAWIQAQGGSDLSNVTCGGGPQVGSGGTTVFSATGALATTATATHTFEVRAGASLLRVSLNGADDVDLYVKAGAPPSPQDYDCKQDGSGAFGVCEFAAPATGTWYATALQYSGHGGYQVTATTFGIDCSDPSNEGAPCDDGNVCTDGDACRSSACAGSAVVNGTPCDDGNLCTNPDACTDGACGSGTQPRMGCRPSHSATAGVVRLQHPQIRQPRLLWRWLKGSATDKASFGNPRSATPYSFCVYDQNAGNDALVMDTRIAPGGMCGRSACWRETVRGFRYTDRRASNAGITGVELRNGIDGKAMISVRGRSAGLNLPALPLHQDSTVTVQFGNATTCWEARYTTHVRNLSTEFRAMPGP